MLAAFAATVFGTVSAKLPNANPATVIPSVRELTTQLVNTRSVSGNEQGVAKVLENYFAQHLPDYRVVLQPVDPDLTHREVADANTADVNKSNEGADIHKSNEGADVNTSSKSSHTSSESSESGIRHNVFAYHRSCDSGKSSNKIRVLFNTHIDTVPPFFGAELIEPAVPGAGNLNSLITETIRNSCNMSLCIITSRCIYAL